MKSRTIDMVAAEDPLASFLKYDSGAVDWQAEVNGDIAEAQVEGTTQFVQGRQRERQPNNFQATLERSGAAWRLATIR